MNKIQYSLILCAAFSLTNVYAAETMEEKADAMGNDIERGTEKTFNRLEEATCMESDVECMKQKAENRVEEASDAIEDKTEEMKNNIDDE